MALTTSSWDRPIQGVSQQPPKVRLPGQCTRQENAVSSAVNGLTKRPGTIWVKDLADSLPARTKYYYYNRGTGEEYFVAIPPNSFPRVFDMQGDELVVENLHPDARYLTDCSEPDANLSLATISDYTFIVNDKFIPKASSSLTSGLQSEAIINVQFADYGRHYRVFLDDDLAIDYVTPDGGQSGHINYVDTSLVASILFTGDKTLSPSSIEGSGINNVDGFYADLIGNTIVVKKTDGSPFSIRTEDGADGRDVFVVKNSVKNVSDLPMYAPDGYKVRVVGEGNTDADDYWLEASESSGDVVTWRETLAPDISEGLELVTMPPVLIRDRFENGKAVFQFDVAPWADRRVGDDDSNPFPSFIQEGQPITSVGTFQNRLYFTAGESVVYSRSNFFFDFFRETVRTSLDDDPIDVLADTNQVNFLRNSSILDGDLVFFSPNGQFVQFGDNPITKENATLRYASTFENTASCQPVAGGDVIFFAFGYGRFAGIREFYTDSFTDTKRARPVTDHVDEFIEGDAKLLATSTNRNQLIVMADPEDTLYIYEWLWQGNERVQSSWSKWIFDGSVKHVAYDNETIYFMIERDGKLHLEYIETGDPDDNGLNFAARLDQRILFTASRQNGTWVGTLPYDASGLDIVVVRDGGCNDPGVTAPFTLDPDGVTITINEDVADPEVDEVNLIAGRRFSMVYEPTMPFIKDRNGRVIETDRLTINDIYINYDKTGQTTVTVENDYGVSREYEFNGRRIGGVTNIVGFSPLSPGQFSFPVRQEADRVTFTIESVSHLPFQLRDMEWRGRFHQRGRRV